jgi:hypothetical protein
VRVELHDGNHAELRDQLTGGDRRRAKAAISVTVGGDEARTFTGELEDKINYALLRGLIVSWSIPQTLPRNAASPEVADGILDDLPIEDIEALCAAVRPHYDRVLNGPKSPTISGSVLSTGTSGVPERAARSRKN